MAFQFAEENNYSVLVTLDADHSHDPNDMPRLIGNLDDFDFVIGSRYVSGGACSCRYRNYQPISKLRPDVALIPTKECTTSGHLMNRYHGDVQKTVFKSGILSFWRVFLHHTADLKIAELPINFIDRKHGISKIQN